MKVKTEKLFLFYLFFLGFLTLLMMIQSAFLPSGRYSFMPYLIWPPLILLFLRQKLWVSLYFLLFISTLSCFFLSLSAPVLFCLYLFCFLLVLLIKSFFLSRPAFLFFSLVFSLSFIFPYLIDLGYDFSINDLSLFTIFFNLLRALSTLILSFLFFPFLKKHIPISS